MTTRAGPPGPGRHRHFYEIAARCFGAAAARENNGPRILFQRARVIDAKQSPGGLLLPGSMYLTVSGNGGGGGEAKKNH